MKKKLLGLLVAVGVAACGGGDDDDPPPPPACTPSGSYNLTDTITSSSGGFCQELVGSDQTIVNVTVDTAARTFTWNEEGVPFTGTIDLGTCAGAVTATLPFDLGDGHIVTATAIRTVTFSGSRASGTVSGTVSVDPNDLPGFPCSISGTFTGPRQ